MSSIQKLDEKWRPKTFTDLVGNAQIVDDVRIMVRNKDVPHLLFSGKQGTGKTSLALVIVRELFSGDTKRKYIELNASDKRGIDVVRNRIKKFAEMSANIKDVPFRIVILDECSELTDDAQMALRRTMEIFSRHCRFILICNYKHKLIKPLLSRCQERDFKPIKPEEMLPRLEYICEREGIDIAKDGLEYIAHKSNGDVRKAINSYIERFKVMNHGTMTLERIMALQPPEKYTQKILSAGLNNHFLKGQTYFTNAVNDGNEVRRVLIDLNQMSLKHDKYSDKMKGDISLECLNSEFKLLTGCTDELVICSFVRRLGIIGSNYK